MLACGLSDRTCFREKTTAWLWAERINKAPRGPWQAWPAPMVPYENHRDHLTSEYEEPISKSPFNQLWNLGTLFLENHNHLSSLLIPSLHPRNILAILQCLKKFWDALLLKNTLVEQQLQEKTSEVYDSN